MKSYQSKALRYNIENKDKAGHLYFIFLQSVCVGALTHISFMPESSMYLHSTLYVYILQHGTLRTQELCKYHVC